MQTLFQRILHVTHGDCKQPSCNLHASPFLEGVVCNPMQAFSQRGLHETPRVAYNSHAICMQAPFQRELCITFMQDLLGGCMHPLGTAYNPHTSSFLGGLCTTPMQALFTGVSMYALGIPYNAHATPMHTSPVPAPFQRGLHARPSEKCYGKGLPLGKENREFEFC